MSRQLTVGTTNERAETNTDEKPNEVLLTHIISPEVHGPVLQRSVSELKTAPVLKLHAAAILFDCLQKSFLPALKY